MDGGRRPEPRGTFCAAEGQTGVYTEGKQVCGFYGTKVLDLFMSRNYGVFCQFLKLNDVKNGVGTKRCGSVPGDKEVILEVE